MSEKGSGMSASDFRFNRQWETWFYFQARYSVVATRNFCMFEIGKYKDGQNQRKSIKVLLQKILKNEVSYDVALVVFLNWRWDVEDNSLKV